MNLRPVLFAIATGAGVLTSVLAIVHRVEANIATTIEVDDDAPVAASLLPALSVTARLDGATEVALDDVDVLPVTLLPTVHVRASARMARDQSALAAAPTRDPARVQSAE
ncbi:MAG: hypothetical protein KF903_14055 [Dokdonella sp.]|uniref:hypothetical protein n=1 Tax=Dokdonella sp. TaxID=2291710 RepID=UPI0025BB3760|nr:hypothetical protein [Dokdonella sp.]MBX3702111.1 hypothetical protein [Dokdonella sp.]